MAISKIILNGITQMDLTQDTTDASKTLASYTGHGADGEAFTGSYVPQIGVDIPVFTDDGQTITCNKTFAECFAIVDDGKTAAMITDGYGWEASISANIYSSSQITYTLCDNLGKPYVDFFYNSNGTISSTTPSHASPVLTTKSITANGTYNASSDNADGYSSVTVNVSGSTGKNVQAYRGYDTVSSQTYVATDVTITVAKTGTYNVSWMGFRNTTSGTSGSQLYKNGNAVGTASTTFVNSYGQSVSLSSQSFTKDDVLVVRARSRNTSYVMGVGNLIIEEV